MPPTNVSAIGCSISDPSPGKNAIGMSEAVRKLGVRDQRSEQEAAFTKWAEADPARAEYLRALPLIAQSKEISVPIASDIQVLAEAVLMSIDVATIAVTLNGMLPELSKLSADEAKAAIAAVYKDYNEATDIKVTKRMVELLMEMVSPANMPEFITADVEGRFNGNVEEYIKWLYETSVYANEEKFEKAFAAGNVPADDPALAIFNTTYAKYKALYASKAEADQMFNEGHKLYIKGLLEMDADGKHYPDANFTIRLTYGNVKPYSPADAVNYNYYTTTDGILEKENPEDSEFVVPARLHDLCVAEDFGPYAEDGEMRVCFISTNDITGGNSGSPVLNAEGQLIGLAFDGNWDAMSGDVLFEKNMQRCIDLDVRYVLFIIDKFAGAGHLLDEMNIVWE